MRFATVDFNSWRQGILADPRPFVAVLQRRPYPCVATVFYPDRDDLELVVLHDAGEYEQFQIMCRQQTAPDVTKALVLLQPDPVANTVDIIVGGPPDPPGGPNLTVTVQRPPASQPAARVATRQQVAPAASRACECAVDRTIFAAVGAIDRMVAPG